MAESAVKGAADLLGKILIEEGKYLWGAQGKVEELRDELLWMQSFLREADTIQYRDESVGMWVSQIKQHVYEAEDIIDDFVIKVASRRRVTGFLNKAKRYSLIFRELYHLHQAASSIDSLKVKISTLSPKLEKYGLKRYLRVNTDKAQEDLVEQVQQGLQYAHTEYKKIVGLEMNAKEVINALKGPSPNKGFHAIYGMGGLGKTTLATKVCQADEIKQHFNGGRAFVYISKQFQRQNVLQNVLKELTRRSSDNKELTGRSLDDKELTGSSDDDTNLNVSTLPEVLKKRRCLVVLDDIWTQQAWEILKPAFAACGGDSGSKVLITTRNEEVAKYVDPVALHKPDPLNKDESWELLQKMMGWDLQKSSGYEKDPTSTFGSNDEKIKHGKEMLKVCNGLPLAIVALGGILRTKQTLGEWETVHKNISSHLRMGSDHGRSCMDILLQSYNDLPFHLKRCFLHLAHYPEDHKISTENLYGMWAAEGLVTDRTSGRRSLEEVANDYLNELALVGLVEIGDKTSEGLIRSIRMHDLVREVCLEKATIEDFLITMDVRAGRDGADDYSSNRVLQLSICLPHPEEAAGVDVDSSTIIDCVASRGHKHLRSLLFVVPLASGDWEDKYQQLVENICNEFQMLRVLCLRNMRLKGSLTSRVGDLLHLRYLSLESTGVTELPSSIGKLRFLEILNLGVCGELIIPNTLWKLTRLRHLLLPERICGYKIKNGERLRVDTLIWLETIENMRVRNHGTKDLLKMKSLKRLSVVDPVSEEEELEDIIGAVKSSFGSLASCSLIVDGNLVSKKPTILSGFVCNHKLHIVGRISVPPAEYSSQYLVSLTLGFCELEEDPMSILGSLCHLASLYLIQNCYAGKKLSCRSNGNIYSFPLLTEFAISDLENLEAWELEDGSMLKLESVSINKCPKLKGVPHVLPSSLKAFFMFFISEPWIQTHSPLTDLMAPDAKHNMVALLGNGGFDVDIVVAYHDRLLNLCGIVVARACVPRRRRDALLPRRVLQKILRSLIGTRSFNDCFSMNCDQLKREIQQIMQKCYCVVILESLHLHHHNCLQQLMDAMYGYGFKEPHIGPLPLGKLILTTSTSKTDELLQSAANKSLLLEVFEFPPQTPTETHQIFIIHNQLLKLKYPTFWESDAGIKWNMLRHCSDHPLSTSLLAGLMETKDNISDWATKHSLKEKLTGSNPQTIFAMCYNDLPLHLKSCLIFLANFPEDVDIPTKRLFQMWIAAGFVRSKHEDQEVKAEEHLENLARKYLTDLVQRGMVVVGKEGPYQRPKRCQLRFALRDMCLEKAKEEHILTIVDLFDNATSTPNGNIKTQQLAVHFDQISSSTPSWLDEEYMDLNPTSLVIIPNVSDPVLYSEEKWDWLLYICKHFQLLRVLDVEGMWLTKGSLPIQVGSLRQLRYLSLKGTWVNQLPQSVQNLTNLQTLNLRVLEFIPIILPDVFWKLNSLLHLYLPDNFETVVKLKLHGLRCLQTLVNLDADKVCLNDLRELKLLSKIFIKMIQAVDVNELDEILKHLSKSLEVSIDSRIINASRNILSSFRNLHNLKIKGELIALELDHKMFPPNLEELTLKHTELKKDPLPVLENLLELRSLFLDHLSFSGDAMTFSETFQDRTILTIRSLKYLKDLHVSKDQDNKPNQVVIIDCWRAIKREP